MRTKNIEKRLRRVFMDWTHSISDKEVRDLARKHCYITGGCITSLILGETVHDYDIYIDNMGAAKAITEYYVEKFKESSLILHSGVAAVPITVACDFDKNRVKICIKSAGIAAEGVERGYKYFEQENDDDLTEDYVDRQFHKANLDEDEWSDDEPQPDKESRESSESSESPDTPKVIQLIEIGEPAKFIGNVAELEEKILENVDRESNRKREKFRPVFLTSNAITLSDRIQIIIRFVGSPKKVHENYDFIHVTNYWRFKDGLHLNKEALASIATKELKVINGGSKYPICTLFRLRKFIARGWTITAGQILKIALQVSDLDLSNPEVLEDQLIGVDVAYFSELLNEIKKDNPEKIDRAYLVQIIDKIF